MTVRRFDFQDGEPINNGGSPHEPAERPDGGAYVRDLWNFLRRNRLIITIVPLLALGAAVLGTRYIRPIYEAETTIRIDEERSSVPILDVLKTLSSSGSGIGTEMQVLRSRTLAEAVIDSLRLQVRLLEPRSASRDALVQVGRVERLAPKGRYEIRREAGDRFEVRRRGQSEVVARVGVGEAVRVAGTSFELQPAALQHDQIVIGVDAFDDVLRSVRRRLVVGRPSRDADIVEARYQDSDRMLTAAVPNVLADRFIAFRSRDRSRESQSTIRFLDDQLGEISGQLRMAEGELQQFREGTGVISLEAEARANIAGLGELKANRDALAAEATALRQVLNQIARSSEAGAQRDRTVLAFPTLLRIPAASQLLTSLVDLEDERARRLQVRRPEDAEIVALDRRIREVEGEIVSIGRTYLQGLSEQVASLDGTLSQFRSELQRVPAREIDFARLQRQVSGLEEIYTALATTLKEQQVLAAVEDASIRVVDPAVPPSRPVRPNLPLTMALALLVGSVIGVGAAFVREQVDTAVHTREDLQKSARGVPLLGTIPRIRAAAKANGRLRRGAGAPVTVERLVAANEPHSPAAEAYRTLRTSVAFSRSGAPPATLVFTSPLPGDGKSTSASNYAITLARQGVRCVIVDADMRRGTLHGVFGAAKEPGLSNVLLGRTTAAAAIQQVRVGDLDLAVLTGGVTPPNPAELLGSSAMASLLEELSQEYEAIVIDAPPLNLVTDAALVGVHADGVILVARAGVTDRAAVAYAMEQLRSVRARVLGTILNDSGDGRERYYGSYVPDSEELVTR
jgi:tyrosine-protein kinase Etk/Wzc